MWFPTCNQLKEGALENDLERIVEELEKSKPMADQLALPSPASDITLARFRSEALHTREKHHLQIKSVKENLARMKENLVTQIQHLQTTLIEPSRGARRQQLYAVFHLIIN